MIELDLDGLPERLAQLLAQGGLREAETLIETLLAAAPDWRLWRVRGDLAWRRAEPERALEAYQQALLIDAGQPELHARCGRLLLEARALDAALHHLEAARAFAPQALEHTLTLIEMYLLLGDRAAAMVYLKDALGLDAAHPAVFALLGRALLLYGRIEEAQAALLQSLELDAQAGAVLPLLQLALRQGRHALVPPLLPSLPASAEGLYWQGLGHYWQGDHPQARECWLAAANAGSAAALLQLTIAAPLVSFDRASRLKWQELAREGLVLLTEQALPLDQPLEWPWHAHLPEAGAEMAVRLGVRLQALIPALPQLRLRPQERYRVGLLASNLDRRPLCDAAVQLLSLHSHPGLEWQLFYLQPGEPPADIVPWAAQAFQVPNHGEALARLLGDFGLDALLYLDLEQCLYPLALRAPAPLQLLMPTWPVASGLAGLPQIQVRLQLAEPPLLARPDTQAGRRQDWQLPRLGQLCLCPLPPQAWLPEFDAELGSWLEANRKLFVLGPQLAGSALHTRVMQRQAESLGEAARRIKWLEVADARWPELLGLADLVYEPVAGAAWACFQALAAGVPVISDVAGSGQHWLKRMGLDEDLKAGLLNGEILGDRARHAMLKERLQAGRPALLDQADVVSRLEAGLYTEMTRLSHDHP